MTGSGRWAGVIWRKIRFYCNRAIVKQLIKEMPCHFGCQGSVQRRLIKEDQSAKEAIVPHHKKDRARRQTLTNSAATRIPVMAPHRFARRSKPGAGQRILTPCRGGSNSSHHPPMPPNRNITTTINRISSRSPMIVPPLGEKWGDFETYPFPFARCHNFTRSLSSPLP